MADPVTVNTTVKLPSNLEPFLTLLDIPYNLPICETCKAALLPRSVMDHFRKHHHGLLSTEHRKAMRSLVASLPPLDFKEISTNPQDSTPVEALRVVDAFQCKHCTFIRRDLTDVRKHINHEHELSATGNYCQVKAQTWFGGRRAVYWRVRVGEVEAEGTEKSGAEAEHNTTYNPMADGEKDPEARIPPDDPAAICRFGFFGKGWGQRNPI